MSIWRGISKVLFWISFVGCSIGVLILSFATMADGDVLFGLLLLLGGILADMILHASFGMFLELCDNVAEIRGELWSVNKNTKALKSDPDPAQSYSTNSGPALNKLTAINNGENYSCDYWICKDCNTKNDRLAAICKGCGKYK